MANIGFEIHNNRGKLLGELTASDFNEAIQKAKSLYPTYASISRVKDRNPILDKERLDWLEKNSKFLTFSISSSLREEIDKMMKQDNKNLLIDAFNTYARTSKETATYYLEACDWDLESAKTRYWLEIVLNQG